MRACAHVHVRACHGVAWACTLASPSKPKQAQAASVLSRPCFFRLCPSMFQSCALSDSASVSRAILESCLHMHAVGPSPASRLHAMRSMICTCMHAHMRSPQRDAFGHTQINHALVTRMHAHAPPRTCTAAALLPGPYRPSTHVWGTSATAQAEPCPRPARPLTLTASRPKQAMPAKLLRSRLRKRSIASRVSVTLEGSTSHCGQQARPAGAVQLATAHGRRPHAGAAHRRRQCC